MKDDSYCLLFRLVPINSCYQMTKASDRSYYCLNLSTSGIVTFQWLTVHSVFHYLSFTRSLLHYDYWLGPGDNVYSAPYTSKMNSDTWKMRKCIVAP